MCSKFKFDILQTEIRSKCGVFFIFSNLISLSVPHPILAVGRMLKGERVQLKLTGNPVSSGLSKKINVFWLTQLILGNYQFSSLSLTSPQKGTPV